MQWRGLTLGIVLAALVLAVAGIVVAIAVTDDDERRTVTASGTHERMVAPEVATARLGVTARRPEAQAAAEAASRTLRDMVAAVRDVGVDELQTEPVRLRRAPGRGGDAPAAERPYVARQTISVRLRDLDRVAAVIDAAVRAGATDVAGPSFELADPREARRQALAAAVADARANAGRIADVAGVGLGRPLHIEERGGGGPQPTAVQRDSAAASTPVVPGPIAVEAGVTVTFAIE